MGYKATNWARKIQFTGELSTKMNPFGLKAVLFNLANYKNDSTGLCNPTIRTQAADLSTDKGSVQNKISELRRLGLIKIRSGAGTRPSEYTLVGSDDAAGISPQSDNVVSIAGCKPNE
jgi:hypothetical protein